LSPSPARCASIVTSLMPASRHQDHTTSPSATGALVSCANRVHRIPHPTFVTIAIRPSSRGGTREPWSVSGEADKRDGCGRLARWAIYAWQASALTYPRDMFPVIAGLVPDVFPSRSSPGDRLFGITGDASLRAKRSNLECKTKWIVWIASSLALLAMTSLRPPETMTAEDQTRVS
jgi:hypothetical protein